MIVTHYKSDGTVVEEEEPDIVLTEEELRQQRLNELKRWFDTTYRYKFEKYNRLCSLDRTDDDGISSEIKLRELYEEAEDVRKEIQKLEGE